jgi:hypothetical protein
VFCAGDVVLVLWCYGAGAGAVVLVLVLVLWCCGAVVLVD